MKGKLSTLCLILALGCLAVAQAQSRHPDPSGTWKWNRANPDGQIPDITVTLKLQGETLTGTITKRSGTTAITNGVLHGDEVSFQTVRESKGRKTTATYSGKLSGDTIKGNVEIEVGDQVFSSDWGLKRVKQK
jgi:hypothetical protein